jgi:hypothetical protein
MSTEVAEVVREAFNANGAYVSLATAGADGRPDVAPVGTGVLREDGSVFLLQGPLDRSYANLRANPAAVLMIVDNSLMRWIRFFFTGVYGRPHGWRIHCRLREDLPLQEPYLSEALTTKFGGAKDTKGGRAIAATLHRVLVFDVEEVREVVWHAPDGAE